MAHGIEPILCPQLNSLQHAPASFRDTKTILQRSIQTCSRVASGPYNSSNASMRLRFLTRSPRPHLELKHRNGLKPESQAALCWPNGCRMLHAEQVLPPCQAQQDHLQPPFCHVSTGALPRPLVQFNSSDLSHQSKQSCSHFCRRRRGGHSRRC